MQVTILEKFSRLPKSLQVEVLHYIEFLFQNYVQESALESPSKRRRAGLLKEKIRLADDFDAPLEDFRDYQ